MMYIVPYVTVINLSQ